MSKINYLSSSIKQYLDDLSSNKPSPGGGSAAALVASCGVSCLLMVVNFTIEKKGYEQYQQQLKEILNQLEQHRQQLQEYIDKDAQAYSSVVEAYKLPKDTPLDIEIREKKIQEALKNSTTVSFEIMLLTHKCLPYAEKLVKIGNKNLVTDIACGALFLSAGIQAAKYNVVINLKHIKDSNFIENIKPQIRKIVTDAKIISKKVLQKIQI